MELNTNHWRIYNMNKGLNHKNKDSMVIVGSLGTKRSKVVKVMATTAIVGMLLGGALFEPTTTFAAGKKQVTTTTKANVQNKDKKVSVTQNGITLTVMNTIFDGNHVQLEVKRGGGGLTSGVTEGGWDEEQQDYILSKGAIKNIEILIDGKSIHTFGDIANRPSLSWIEGSAKDTAQITLVDPSWLGDQLYSFPDKFKLTAKITLEGTKQPFTLELPMQLTNKANTLQPKITKNHDGLSVTVNKVNATTQSTRIQVIEKGVTQDQTSNLNYEIVDDRGDVLKMISGFGTNNNKAGDWYRNFVMEALNKDVKSITIKPFETELEDPEKTTGSYKLDENGNIVKHYVKELEMKVTVK
jgi:hypothetical protein